MKDWWSGQNRLLQRYQDDQACDGILGYSFFNTCVPGARSCFRGESKKEKVAIVIKLDDVFNIMKDDIYEKFPQRIVKRASNFDTKIEGKGCNKSNEGYLVLSSEFRRSIKYPIVLDFSCPVQRGQVRKRIHEILREAAGTEMRKMEMVLGEAMMNAVKFGSIIQVKINKIGSTLILRVKDDGKGFNGNFKVAEYASLGLKQVFDGLLHQEGGRGIPLMMNWTDKILYNEKGNEAMLI